MTHDEIDAMPAGHEMDALVAKVCHELRTPLTSVKEGLRLMLDGALGPRPGSKTIF